MLAGAGPRGGSAPEERAKAAAPLAAGAAGATTEPHVCESCEALRWSGAGGAGGATSPKSTSPLLAERSGWLDARIALCRGGAERGEEQGKVHPRARG